MTASPKHISKSTNPYLENLLLQIRTKKPITKKQLDTIGGSLEKMDLNEAKLKKMAWAKK